MPFFEKPPVWFTIGTTLSRISPFSRVNTLRAFSALSGVLLIGTVFLVAYRTWGLIAGITEWIVLITTNHLFVSNLPGIFSTHTLQSADGDALFVLFILCSAVLCLGIQHSNSASVGAGIFTGLAVLTKSPLGYIPLLVQTIFIYATEKKGSKNLIRAWCISFLLFCCWFIPMGIVYKYDFLSEYVTYHVFKRAIIPIEQHSESLWFYVTILFSKQVFLFMEVYILSTLAILRSKKIFKDRTLLFIWVSSLCFLVIPTLIQTKLSWYIFPFYPFAALTISGVVAHVGFFSRFSGKRV